MKAVENGDFSVGKGISCYPSWLPAAALRYLEHTVTGQSLRQLARKDNVHPSTVLRQVRRFENRRDDPLVDEALHDLSQGNAAQKRNNNKDLQIMGALAMTTRISDNDAVEREARRILRRLCETTAFLAVAPNMDKAVVMRETIKGRPTRTAVVKRNIAHAFALKDWISVYRTGKVTSYEITAAGRSALKRLLAEDLQRRPQKAGFAEAPSAFSEQHKDWSSAGPVAPGEGTRQKLRYNLAESPMTAVGRRKDKHGKCFLCPEQMQAGDRLREDFELAQMGPRITQNWDRFLSQSRSSGVPDSGVGDGPAAARQRVAAALRFLGPGLGDIAMRCCCFLEGMEAAEKRMGWSARSGKIVLRIALQRLRLHYEEGTDPSRLIG